MPRSKKVAGVQAGKQSDKHSDLAASNAEVNEPTHAAKVLLVGDPHTGKATIARRLLVEADESGILSSPVAEGVMVRTSRIIELTLAQIEGATYGGIPVQEFSQQAGSSTMTAGAGIPSSASKAIIRLDVAVVTPTPALRTITMHQYYDAAAAIFVYDPKRPSTFDHAMAYMDDVKQTMGKSVVVSMLVASKGSGGNVPADTERRTDLVESGGRASQSADTVRLPGSVESPWPTGGPDDSTVDDAQRKPITLEQAVTLAEKHRAVFVDLDSLDAEACSQVLPRLAASIMRMQRAGEPIGVRDLRSTYEEREGKVKPGRWNCCHCGTTKG